MPLCGELKAGRTDLRRPGNLCGRYLYAECTDEGIQRRRRTELSKKEIQLLHYFLEHPGQIISKEQILEAVWGLDGQFVDDNTVPVTISRLKKRLSSKEEGEYIKNVRGLGYLWTTKVSKNNGSKREAIHLAGTETEN